MNIDKFNASAPMLGYIYQARYALLLALKKMREVDDPDESYISIEKLDDIAFAENGSPEELLQTKFHASPGNITDRSPDIWKTIRIWSELVVSGHVTLGDTVFTLVTTQAADLESISSYLSVEADCRDADAALGLLESISLETNNTNNKVSYDAFNQLDSTQKKIMVSSIYVIGLSDSFDDIDNAIKKHLRLSVGPNHIDAFAQRLDGHWLKNVIRILNKDSDRKICLGELQSYINGLQEQFLPQSLPSDYALAEPDEMDVDNDMRVFLKQIRLLGVTRNTLQIAITNYYRAIEQRNRWSRDGLLRVGELGEYDRKLKDEWQQIKSLVDLEMDASNEAARVVCGKSIYVKCQSDEMPKIRSGFSDMFLSRGTVHLLADNLSIGWHPDYLSLISSNDAGVA